MGRYVAPSYVAKHGVPQPDYAGHLAIGFDDRLRGIPEARWLAREAKKARIVFRTDATLVMLAAAMDGVGFALLPAYLGSTE